MAEDRTQEDVGSNRLPIVGTAITSMTNRTYRLSKVLGEGGYGTVFEGRNHNGEVYALKAEQWSKTVLRMEIAVLRAVNQRRARHFCELVDVGTKEGDYMFIVLTLLGDDLAKLRNSRMPERRFSVATAVRIGLQTLKAIQELHEAGFISRDVKPSNFAIGRHNPERRQIYMIDFGLSRLYVDRNNNVLAPRLNCGWRGTTRYGSLGAHQHSDLGRKDDLESWIYMVGWRSPLTLFQLIELTRGSLPWRAITDRSAVHLLKLESRAESKRAEFLLGCPTEYDHMLTLVDQMTFYTEPNYRQFSEPLTEWCLRNGIGVRTPYDWEPDTESSHSNRSSCLTLSDAREDTEAIRHLPDF